MNEVNNTQTYQKQLDEIFCRSCGKPIKKEAEICPYCGVRQVSNSNEKSEKNWATCLLFCIFLWPFGIHRFYAGRIASAIIILLFTIIFIITFFTYSIRNNVDYRYNSSGNWKP